MTEVVRFVGHLQQLKPKIRLFFFRFYRTSNRRQDLLTLLKFSTLKTSSISMESTGNRIKQPAMTIFVHFLAAVVLIHDALQCTTNIVVFVCEQYLNGYRSGTAKEKK